MMWTEFLAAQKAPFTAGTRLNLKVIQKHHLALHVAEPGQIVEESPGGKVGEAPPARAAHYGNNVLHNRIPPFDDLLTQCLRQRSTNGIELKPGRLAIRTTHPQAR